MSTEDRQLTEAGAYLDVLTGLVGVRGAALYEPGTETLRQALPPGLAGLRGVELARLCAGVVGEYRGASRPVREVVLAYARQALVIAASPPRPGLGADDVPLIMFALADDTTAAPVVLAVMRSALEPAEAETGRAAKAVAEVMPPASAASWQAFARELRELLLKVMASAQADMLIQRMLRQLGTNATEGLPPARYAEFALALLLEIPNRARQDSLRPEVNALLARHR